MSILKAFTKTPILRRMFKKDVPPQLVFDIEDVGTRESTHVFDESSRTEARYCSIIGKQQSLDLPGVSKVKLAWRINKAVESGDIFILRTPDGQKTYRLIEINPPNGDISTGLAYCLQ